MPGAPAEPQPEQPAVGACGRPVADNADHLPCAGSTLGRTDSTLTDSERQLLARYPCINRVRLAELREAFLLIAAGNAPTLTPRMAAATADSARLDAADIGTCLRAIGQNPTQADIARITGVMASYQQQQQLQQQQQSQKDEEDAGGAAAAAEPASATNRSLTAALDRRLSSVARSSGLQTPTNDGVSVLRPLSHRKVYFES